MPARGHPVEPSRVLDQRPAVDPHPRITVCQPTSRSRATAATDSPPPPRRRHARRRDEVGETDK